MRNNSLQKIEELKAKVNELNELCYELRKTGEVQIEIQQHCRYFNFTSETTEKDYQPLKIDIIQTI